MALIQCTDCGKNVSTEATACPNCGAKPEKPRSLGTWIFIGLFGLFVFKACGPTDPKSSLPAVQKTPDELANEKKKEARFQKTTAIVRQVKHSMREPESAVWRAIHANDDASIVCIEYSGRNGFGGMSREMISVADGKPSQSADAWNKRCGGKSLYDLSYVKHALK
ncbi:MAG: zinc ribbon domain-containing protein [Burkholderiaceae bacterium]|nr:zinc ribbon domain-containing protein [Burkholderiaceae bacterium]